MSSLDCGGLCHHTDEEHGAFDAGVEAGKKGADAFRDCPHPEPFSSLREAWMTGHSVGTLMRGASSQTYGEYIRQRALGDLARMRERRAEPDGPVTLEENLRAQRYRAESRLEVFERYIHVNECSDEGGYFAFFTPSGTADEHECFDWRVNGCESEEEAIKELVTRAVECMKKAGATEKEPF